VWFDRHVATQDYTSYTRISYSADWQLNFSKIQTAVTLLDLIVTSRMFSKH
jgi:hypothetical protein